MPRKINGTNAKILTPMWLREDLSFEASSAIIGPSNSFSICIFFEKQRLEENQGSWQSCNRVDIEIKEQIEFDVDTAYIKV